MVPGRMENRLRCPCGEVSELESVSCNFRFKEVRHKFVLVSVAYEEEIVVDECQVDIMGGAY